MDQRGMRIEYDTTIDEMVTTQMLCLRGSSSFSKCRNWGLFYWAGITFLVIYFGSGPVISKALVGLLFGALIGGRMTLDPKSIARNRIRKVLMRKLGSQTSFPSSIQLTDDEIEYSANHSTISFQLNDLSTVEEINNGLLLDFTRSNIQYIPDSAFKSNVEKIEWKRSLDEICSKNT